MVIDLFLMVLTLFLCLLSVLIYNFIRESVHKK